MKQLQKDFTTPEQSQRLSELGVPTNSANGILLHYAWAEENLDEKNWETPKYIENNIPTSEALDMYLTDQDEYDIAIPCWSVGRLIEIALKCSTLELAQVLFDTTLYEVSCLTNIEWTIIVLDSAIKCEHIDFSKLEE